METLNLSKYLKSFYNKLELSKDECRLYKDKEKRRYYYFKEIQDNSKRGNKKATVIMINPSEAKNHSDTNTPDNTINNLYNILRKNYKEVSCFEVINLYSHKNPKLKSIYDQKPEELNINVVKKVVENAELIIPAWGIENKYDVGIKNLISEIKNLCKNKEVKIVVNKYPCHFTTQCTSVGRNPQFIKYEF